MQHFQQEQQTQYSLEKAWEENPWPRISKHSRKMQERVRRALRAKGTGDRQFLRWTYRRKNDVNQKTREGAQSRNPLSYLRRRKIIENRSS